MVEPDRRASLTSRHRRLTRKAASRYLDGLNAGASLKSLAIGVQADRKKYVLGLRLGSTRFSRGDGVPALQAGSREPGISGRDRRVPSAIPTGDSAQHLPHMSCHVEHIEGIPYFK